MKKTFLLFAVLFVVAGLRAQTMDLSGLWRFQFDPMGFGMTPGSELYLSRLGGSIALPGSTDQAGLGVRNEASYCPGGGPAGRCESLFLPLCGYVGRQHVLCLSVLHAS